MLTYTYKCTNEDCEEFDKEFQVKRRISEDKLTTCEHCKQESLQQVIEPSTFRLKGSGWFGQSHVS